jgi:hypothetical protein
MVNDLKYYELEMFIYVKYHIGSTISMITNYKRNAVRNNTMFYSHLLMHNQGSERSINNNSIRNIYIYSDSTINSLDIADGLKELLNKYGFTLNELLNMPSSELAEFLGIDKYVAQIIGRAATKLSNIDKASDELQTKNCVTF